MLMKNLTDLFIRRPVVALVVNLVILIAGFQAIKSLNVRQYPRSENAAVTVTTVYVGASAELVRGFITTPLERAIAAADGIEAQAVEQSAYALHSPAARQPLLQPRRKFCPYRHRTFTGKIASTDSIAPAKNCQAKRTLKIGSRKGAKPQRKERRRFAPGISQVNRRNGMLARSMGEVDLGVTSPSGRV